MSEQRTDSAARNTRNNAARNNAAAFFGGPAEFLDFVLPIVAGQSLGATGAQTGALVAAELAVSLLVRPLAGRLVDGGILGSPGIESDRIEAQWAAHRTRAAKLASLGALVYLLSFLIYAASGSLPPAFLAAVLGGAGGALFWVSLRALVALNAESGHARFAELMENESAGSWIAFVIGIPLFQLAGHQVTFLAGAASCLVAALLLWPRSAGPRNILTEVVPPAQNVPTEDVPAGTSGGRAEAGPGLLGSLRGILILTAVVACAEAIVGLLLILRLQHDLGLELGSIAMVYLPGAIVLSVAPRPLHRIFERTPPRWILVIGLGSSAAFAAAMAFRPGALALAVLWILAALCWSLMIPLLERLVAEVSGSRAGRGFGHYQSAELLGAAIGSLLAGILFGADLWVPATLGAAIVLIAAALYGSRALRAFSAVDCTPSKKGINDMKRSIRNLSIHIGIYLVAQIVFAAVSQSWPWEVLTGGADITSILDWNAPGTDVQRWMGSISRIWTIVVVVDVIWSGYRILVPKQPSETTVSPE